MGGIVDVLQLCCVVAICRHTFSTPLKLSKFTLDDFFEAMLYKENDCHLMVQVSASQSAPHTRLLQATSLTHYPSGA